MIIAFDVETTGTDPYLDRIVELALISLPDGKVLIDQLFNPGVPIPMGATEVHGIRDVDVAEAPAFSERAKEIQATIEGAVLLGFRSRTFDTLVLHNELSRAGEPGLDLDSVLEMDLFGVWKAQEPHTLNSAVRRFLSREHEGHRALPDAQVLGELLEAMKTEWGLDDDDLIRLSRPGDEVDRYRYFRRDPKSGEIVFNKGRDFWGEPVREHPSELEYRISRWDLPEQARLKALAMVKEIRRKEATMGLLPLVFMCEKGHVVLENIHDVDDLPDIKYCGVCGASVIFQCPDCEASIHFIFRKPDSRPEFCYSCGKPYPWNRDSAQ